MDEALSEHRRTNKRLRGVKRHKYVDASTRHAWLSDLNRTEHSSVLYIALHTSAHNFNAPLLRHHQRKMGVSGL
eukprot:CAMPEP_0197394542 /NCGR_PEP_ID=MMETSP1165-20131217/5431_1 /TAXON_ID=284809 /ORGANISM="Chrysocystis fragilis, Strain CCMP3189" /LENGTH=73 /DNA_ID=CAMNT_0042920259 /DNA_START=1 /DNA_END=218 /DNA_ORIENTATION=+